jgi:hypothetical protein
MDIARCSDRVRSCQERTLAQNSKSLACNNKTSADCPVKATAAMSSNDYYVVTSKRGEHPDGWSWEIRRRSKPLGVKLMARGFQSDSAAQVAGKRALDEFLSALSKEERRRT